MALFPVRILDALQSRRTHMKSNALRRMTRRLFAASSGAGLSLIAAGQASAAEPVRQEDASADLAHRIGVLEDINAIRALHFKYGYYMDVAMFSEIVELFADDCEIHFLGGIFKGKAGARRLYMERLGRMPDRTGRLFDHLMIQDIVEVAPDRMTAKGRFRNFMQKGSHRSKAGESAREKQSWQSGIYENVFVRRNGVWQIGVFNYHLVWEAPVEGGWAEANPAEREAEIFRKTFPEDPLGPDELEKTPPRFWPHPVVVPFHYPNPVTGR
jgi:hypothetical protein